MEHYRLALLVMVLQGTSSSAQTFSTRNDFNNAQGPDEMGWTLVRSDSGYLVIQACEDTMNMFLRVGLAHLSQNGTVSEIRSFGQDGLALYVGWANGTVRSPQGFALCGSTDDGIDNRAIVWQLDEELDSLWTLEPYEDTVDFSGGTMARSKNGVIAAVGGVWHTGQSGRAFLALVDPSGILQNLTEYGTSMRDFAVSVDTCSDGGFVIGGDSWLTGTDHDGFIIKTDAAGSQEWRRDLGGPYRDSYLSVISTSDGGYIAVGAYATYQSGFSTYYRLYAARLNANGDLIWEKQYGQQGSVNELSSVTELHDGTFIAAGLYPSSGGDKGVLLKFAANGDSLWMRTFRHPPLDSVFSVHWLRHVVEDTDGSLVATGSCNDGQQDLWVLRVDSFGCLVPGCQLYDHISEQPGTASKSELNFMLYPNPATGHVYISFRSAGRPKGEFRLYDPKGARVRRFAPTSRSEELEIALTQYPSGSYLICYVESIQGVRWAQTLIKE